MKSARLWVAKERRPAGSYAEIELSAGQPVSFMQKPIHVGPDMRVIHPEFGDMTADVARELTLLNEAADAQAFADATRRQRLIAAQCGQESRHSKGGVRLVAQIDQDIYNYWEQREGRQFWTSELAFMMKRHPEIAVHSKPDNLTVGYRAKRGRWALHQ